MEDITSYVNPRSLGNNEPNDMLHMDIFFEQALWDKYIGVADADLRNTRTYDVVWQITQFCVPRFARGATSSTFPCAFGGDFGGEPAEVIEVPLRAYQHPRLMALCVGLAPPSEV